MSDPPIFLPADDISLELLPASAKRKIGHGIEQTQSTTQFSASIAGYLHSDFKKKSASIATPHARYTPKVGDLVIAQVRGTSQDFFHSLLTAGANSQQAILGHLAFEGATKKTRPQLKAGDLVYAKVTSATKNMEVELSCVNPSTGKSQPDGLGPLTGGMVWNVSIGLADRLLRREGVTVMMEELGGKIKGGFELAVGKNGRVWVNCPEAGANGVIAVGRCLQSLDELGLRESEQKKYARRICTEMNVG